MSSPPRLLQELTTLVSARLILEGSAHELYRPDDIAGFIAWELFHTLHAQGAYLAPAAAGKIRTGFAYHTVMRGLNLIDEEGNITPVGIQHYRSLIPFYFKGEG